MVQIVTGQTKSPSCRSVEGAINWTPTEGQDGLKIRFLWPVVPPGLKMVRVQGHRHFPLYRRRTSGWAFDALSCGNGGLPVRISGFFYREAFVPHRGPFSTYESRLDQRGAFHMISGIGLAPAPTRCWLLSVCIRPSQRFVLCDVSSILVEKGRVNAFQHGKISSKFSRIF